MVDWKGLLAWPWTARCTFGLMTMRRFTLTLKVDGHRLLTTLATFFPSFFPTLLSLLFHCIHSLWWGSRPFFAWCLTLQPLFKIQGWPPCGRLVSAVLTFRYGWWSSHRLTELWSIVHIVHWTLGRWFSYDKLGVSKTLKTCCMSIPYTRKH